MAESAKRVASEEYAWLASSLETVPGDRHYVSELLPPGYAHYVRVLDPWTPAQSTAPRRTWRDLAAECGVAFYPEISWHELEPAARPKGAAPASILYSGSDPLTRGRVIEHLRAAAPGPYSFAYVLGASVGLDLTPPLVITCDSLDLATVRGEAERAAGRPHPVVDDPEHWWPSNREWVVNRDYDLDELYIAGNDSLVAQLLEDPALETVEVQLGSRVDWTVNADRRATRPR
ncbi:MAG: hypothetical protein JJU45_11625 [Acidimicrobiia bacterium]|nr:hypothetical protein [Acidimicrobiia bacterium]